MLKILLSALLFVMPAFGYSTSFEENFGQYEVFVGRATIEPSKRLVEKENRLFAGTNGPLFLAVSLTKDADGFQAGTSVRLSVKKPLAFVPATEKRFVFRLYGKTELVYLDTDSDHIFLAKLKDGELVLDDKRCVIPFGSHGLFQLFKAFREEPKTIVNVQVGEILRYLESKDYPTLYMAASMLEAKPFSRDAVAPCLNVINSLEVHPKIQEHFCSILGKNAKFITEADYLNLANNVLNRPGGTHYLLFDLLSLPDERFPCEFQPIRAQEAAWFALKHRYEPKIIRDIETGRFGFTE